MKYWWKYSSDSNQKTISSYICWIPNPLVQHIPLFLSNQIQLYKPNSTGIAEVNLPADALAHPATGAPRAWAQCTTPKTATHTHHSTTEFIEANMVALAFCVSSDSNTSHLLLLCVRRCCRSTYMTCSGHRDSHFYIFPSPTWKRLLKKGSFSINAQSHHCVTWAKGFMQVKVVLFFSQQMASREGWVRKWKELWHIWIRLSQLCWGRTGQRGKLDWVEFHQKGHLRILPVYKEKKQMTLGAEVAG